MNNVESLKNLATKLGVTPVDSELISDQIQNIADNYEGGSGGGGLFVEVDVEEHFDSATNTGTTTLTLSKTWQELKNALDSGILPVFLKPENPVDAQEGVVTYSYDFILDLRTTSEGYYVYIYSLGDVYMIGTLMCASPNEYPTGSRTWSD